MLHLVNSCNAIQLMLFLLMLLFSGNIQAQSSNPSRLFEWKTSKPGDVRLWLKQNESLLSRSDGCSLSASWRDGESKASTSVFNIAEFLVVPEDEEFTATIRHPESGISARVGVRYLPSMDKKLWMIQIALAFEGTEKDVFDELGRTEAETIRDPKWKRIGTTKETRIENKVYRFHLGCENGKTYMNFLRRHN